MTNAPRILIIAGPNGAGKTTFAREFLPNEADCPVFVNADLIAAGLSCHAEDRHPRPLPAARLAGPGREVRRQPLSGDPSRRRRPPPHLQGRQVLPRDLAKTWDPQNASPITPASACRCR
jgi:hypothetical protein